MRVLARPTNPCAGPDPTIATRRRAAIPAALLGLALALPSVAAARTRIVPDDVPTVQAALDSVFAGSGDQDTVLVRAGEYPERLRCRSQVSMIGLPDAGGRVPIVDALFLADERGGWNDILVRGLRFRGGVFVAYPAGYAVFRECLMDSGMVFTLDTPSNVSVIRCAIAGRTYVGGGGNIVVDSCEIRGQIEADNAGGGFDVLHSTLQGSSGSGILGNAGRVTLEGNVIRGFERGIWIGETDSGLTVRDNLIEDCRLDGMMVRAESVGIVGNRVSRCGVGIRTESWDVWASRNTVSDCVSDGMLVAVDYQCVVDSNIVGRCGGDGLRVATTSYGLQRVRHSTVFTNAGSGIVFSSRVETGALVVNNIAYGNGAYGLLSTGAVIPTGSCNDWYANVAGAVAGMDSIGTGLSLWPGFCDVEGGDVHLRSGSPLLDAPGCGSIGALGTGCDTPTSTLVVQFRAERTPEGIRIVWQVGPGATALDPWLERSDDGSSGWMRVAAERSSGGEAVVELDRDARPEREYWYRLMAREGQSITIIGPPLRVAALAAPVFRLAGMSPSPGSGPVHIEFEVGREAEVAVEVFDVQGRLVASLVRSRLPAGAHGVQWSGLDDRGAIAPAGVYAVRYRFPEGQRVGRIVRSR